MKHFIVFLLSPIIVSSKSIPTVCWEDIGPDGPEDVCYKGTWLNTISSPNTPGINVTYASFQGIQYAQSPVGDLRFKSLVPFTLPSNGNI
jgi:hypothetical protein